MAEIGFQGLVEQCGFRARLREWPWPPTHTGRLLLAVVGPETAGAQAEEGCWRLATERKPGCDTGVPPPGRNPQPRFKSWAPGKTAKGEISGLRVALPGGRLPAGPRPLSLSLPSWPRRGGGGCTGDSGHSLHPSQGSPADLARWRVCCGPVVPRLTLPTVPGAPGSFPCCRKRRACPRGLWRRRGLPGTSSVPALGFVRPVARHQGSELPGFGREQGPLSSPSGRAAA